MQCSAAIETIGGNDISMTSSGRAVLGGSHVVAGMEAQLLRSKVGLQGYCPFLCSSCSNQGCLPIKIVC